LAGSSAGSTTFGSPRTLLSPSLEPRSSFKYRDGRTARFQSSPGRYRAMTALLLLGPWTPLLFQGEEFGASTPFVFSLTSEMARCGKQFARDVSLFWRNFPLWPPKKCRTSAVPSDPISFVSCKLDFSERQKIKSFMIYISISCDCAGKTRAFASRNRMVWMARCWDHRVLFSVFSVTTRRMIDCW